MGDLIRAEGESDLSEVVIHIVVTVQLYDQDQLPGETGTCKDLEMANASKLLRRPTK